MPRETGLILDPAYVNHQPAIGHPESPERYRAVSQALERSGLTGTCRSIKARTATEDDIRLVHSRAYMTVVKHDVTRGSPTLSTGDTSLGEHSLDTALLAVGGVLSAVDAVLNKSVRNAFVAVRPPGHHATPSRGMGFCIFNNVAIGARYARKHFGVQRVLIADWDVHHGNGTQDTFYRDGSVFFFSTHQSPWYPGTGAPDEKGEDAGKGCTLNCPFPAGAGHTEILGAFRKKLVPAMETFQPDLVMISAGFDSRRGDPLGRFLLKDSDFAELTSVMLEIADRYAGGRLISVLEGGYDLSGLAQAVTTHVTALRGE